MRSSSIGYALIQPESISTKAVIQIWSTSKIGEDHITFTHAEKEYVITPDVIREALHLPQVTSFASLYPDDEIKNFIESLGYNGETNKLGRLARAKLRKEWNFYFDCIAKCFTNKSSNFDALTQTTQQIGYCLFQNTQFDFATMILEYICFRIKDKREAIYFSRFLHLIFVHLCPDSIFQGDTCLKIYKNGPRSFQDMTNKDVKNKFDTPIVYPEQFLALLQERMPDKYGAKIQEQNVSTHPESNPSTQPKQSTKQSAPSGSSQKVPVVKRIKMRAQKPKRKTIMRDESSEEIVNPDASRSAIPDEEHIAKEAVHGAGIPITQVVDGKVNADTDSDSEDNIPIRFAVKRRVQEQSVSTSVELPKSHQAKRLKKVTFDTLVNLGLAEAEASNPDGSANPDALTNPDAPASAENIVTVDESFPSPDEPRRRHIDCSWENMQQIDQQLQQARMSESEKKRKADRDHHEVKVYKKQKTKRNLTAAMDTQEPGAQSGSEVHRDQTTKADAAAQGPNPDKAVNPDEATNPDDTANPDKESIPDDSTADQVATQEPLTQSVKEGQATQEPPTQRAGESLTEEPILIQPAGSGTMSNSTSFTTNICKNDY